MTERESLVAVDKRVEFTTDRDEIFKRLVQDTAHGYITTEGEHGPGRTYYVTVGNLLDALKAFCDEKESGR